MPPPPAPISPHSPLVELPVSTAAPRPRSLAPPPPATRPSAARARRAARRGAARRRRRSQHRSLSPGSRPRPGWAGVVTLPCPAAAAWDRPGRRPRGPLGGRPPVADAAPESAQTREARPRARRDGARGAKRISTHEAPRPAEDARRRGRLAAPAAAPAAARCTRGAPPATSPPPRPPPPLTPHAGAGRAGDWGPPPPALGAAPAAALYPGCRPPENAFHSLPLPLTPRPFCLTRGRARPETPHGTAAAPPAQPHPPDDPTPVRQQGEEQRQRKAARHPFDR
jgi:hypothetical protein